MIQKKLNKLYQKYSVNAEHFINCGLVNETAYRNSKPRVVFLLKEPHDKERKSNWDLIEYINYCINEDKIHKMWKVAGIWSYAITHQFFPYFNQVNTSDFAAKGLKVIGITNLKKSGGGGQASPNLCKVASDEEPLWTNELKIMEADVVLCGGTFWIVNESISGFKHEQLQCGLHYSRKENNKTNSLMIEFYHPGYRVKHSLMYAHLKELIRELKELSLID